MQEAFGEEMHQLRLLAYFLSGRHIEYVVRNAIRYSKPGMEAASGHSGS
jgi:hypothetical protein